jgi:hypothetical protein
MGLGTKNRQKQTAETCKHHLREKYREKLGLQSQTQTTTDALELLRE